MSLFLSGCNNNDEKSDDCEMDTVDIEESDAHYRLCGYLKNMSQATTDDEKWQLTVVFLQENHKKMAILDMKDIIVLVEKAICSDEFDVSYYSFMWPGTFPGILKHVNLSERSLWLLTKDYDNERHWMMDLLIQTEQGPARVYMSSKATPAETSRKWVQLMIGETFANRAEYEAWLTRHAGQFHWNKEEGRFDIYENPETMPSTGGTNE